MLACEGQEMTYLDLALTSTGGTTTLDLRTVALVESILREP